MDPDRVNQLAHVLKSLALMGVKQSPVDEAQQFPTWYLIDLGLENGGTIGLARKIFSGQIVDIRLNGAGLRLVCGVQYQGTDGATVHLKAYDESGSYPKTTRMMNKFIKECGLAPE